MSSRIKYVEETYGLFITEKYSDRYYTIMKKAEITLMLLIKYNITHDGKIADIVKKYIDEVRAEEQEILESIVQQLFNIVEDRRGRIDWE